MTEILDASLLADIKSGHLRKAISEQDYEAELAKTCQDLYEKYGDVSSIKFDPKLHLTYYSADPMQQQKFHDTRRLTMEELSLSNKNQISQVGVSDPFALFTDEAVDIMKMEILKKETFMEYARISRSSTSGRDCTLRGYVKDEDQVLCPFSYEAWTHPKTMELISIMAGVELEPVMEYEIAQANISVNSVENAEKEKEQHLRESSMRGDNDGQKIPAVVGWHYDSYPFVCVLMLSDTSCLIGGETYLRMGDSKVARVDGPQKGYACVLQGRLIQHLASKPIGGSERITSVTSYRAKNPLLHEGSVLSTVKPEVNWGSRYNTFYPEWIKYRSAIVKERIDALVEGINGEESFDKESAMTTISDICEYYLKTVKEMQLTEKDLSRMLGNPNDL